MTVKLGDSPQRKEDLRLLTGRGRFADDNTSERQLYAFMLASVHAHAEIGNIDTSAARAAPGVVDVLTGEDWLADGFGPIPHNMGFSSPPDIVLENRDGFRTVRRTALSATRRPGASCRRAGGDGGRRNLHTGARCR